MKNIETQKDALIDRYHKQALKKLMILFICVSGTVLIFGLLSVTTYNTMSLKEAYEIIINHIIGHEYPIRTTEWWADFYIWNTAIPRGVVAVIAGASLAAAGTLMQSLMNNPLADPYSTGISSGACFGAVAAIIMGISFNVTSSGSTIVFNAFVGSMIPAAIMIVISKKIEMTPATLILIGTALSYFFNSMVTYMMVTTDADTLHSAYLWQVGTLENVTWDDVPLMFAVTAIGTVFTILMSRQLNIMALGDASAKTLGLDVEKFRIICLTVMALMTASIVSYVGIIGFLGLVAPHLVRMVVGSDNRFVIPISMSVGAFLLILADYFAISFGIPVGVVMSVIGSPIFFALIVFKKKSYGAIY